jgi:hypothetical protein
MCRLGRTMMRAVLGGFPLVFILLSGTPAPATECRAVLESDVKIAAMRAYADVLALAARNGSNYEPEAIDRGNRRHFEEMKVRLSALGYTIVPVGSKAPCRRVATVASQ